MAQEITTINGGEAPLSVREAAARSGSKSGEADSMHQSGGQSPTPGYTPGPTDHSQKPGAESKVAGDPPLGGVARAR